jgi:hypothetical protein
MRTRFVMALLGVGMVAFVWSAGELRQSASQAYFRTQTYEDVYYLPSAQWLPVLSLGYKSALADLLWLKALVYFGEEIHHHGQVKHITHYADAILSLDPYFRAVYRWVSMGILYKPGAATLEDALAAARYLERAIQLFPSDGELAWDSGATWRYEVFPRAKDPSVRQHAKKRGVEQLQAAARLGGGPPWLALTNATELRGLGQTEQAIRHLEEMYATVQNDDTKQQIALQLEALRNRAHVEALEQFHTQWERERLDNYPYVSEALYVWLGNRITTPR